MDKSNDHIENLIICYLNGKCSEVQKQELLDWVNASEENKLLFIRTKDIWDSARQQPDCSNEQLIDFYRRLVVRKEKTPVRHLLRVASMAAMLAVAFVAGILVYSYLLFPEARQIVYSVPLGSKASVELSDGTKISLNSGSTLTYPDNFRGKTRTVSLTGEAYFEVSSDKSHPFIVQTRHFDVRVTGTQFDVCAYDDDQLASATLFEGGVELSGKSFGKMVLNPGERAVVDKINGRLTVENADIQTITSWKDGKFYFKNIPLPDLIKRLERWYDVSIKLPERGIDTLKYSGRFQNQETIWQVLDALKLTSPIDYTRENLREFKLQYLPGSANDKKR